MTDSTALQEGPAKPRTRGRPPAVRLSEQSWAQLATLWRDPAVDGAEIIDAACLVMQQDPGEKKARERVRLRLHRKFGPRDVGSVSRRATGQRPEDLRGAGWKWALCYEGELLALTTNPFDAARWARQSLGEVWDLARPDPR